MLIYLKCTYLTYSNLGILVLSNNNNNNKNNPQR